MKKKLLAKLRSKKGETLGETLLALLISALALTMLAGAISTALNLVTKSNEQMANYYDRDNLVADQSGEEESTTSKATISYEGTVLQPPFDVKCFKNSTFPGTTVVSYVSYTLGD